MKQRILFGASYSNIEPLGLLHLAGLARDEGWDRRIHLVKNHDFTEFFELVKSYKPQIVGFNVYTGNHLQLANAFKRLKRDYPDIITVVGGPHPSYFPVESLQYADYVVMSEGFGALRKILRGEAKPGILPMMAIEPFPHPDRKTFYDDHPAHADSYIKSIISMTGCPYTCTYCYNSSTPADLGENLPPHVADMLGKGMGMTGRLFPKNIRNVEEVIREGQELAEKWPTDVVYFQDDVFGFDFKPNGFLDQMATRWPTEVEIPFHAQMRWEMTINPSGVQRLDMIREAGGFGLTLAIEAADFHIRKEVLDRAMPEKTMFEGMKNVSSRGFKVRTEQITGLPYGATTEPTKMNLDADIELLELNIRLKKEAGGPTMAWASTLAPYKGTKLGAYCERFGHYESDNSDVPDTFFEESVLKFPREWVGPNLSFLKRNDDVWLSDSELEKYRKQNAELRRLFNFFAEIPMGHLLAKSYLESNKPFDYERLGEETYDHLHKWNAARQLIGIEYAHLYIDTFRDITVSANKDLRDLAPLFACLPGRNDAIRKVVEYSNKKEINNKVLSTAIRHHLYDNVLYSEE